MKHYFTHPLTIAASCLLILFSSCAEGTSEEKEETLTNQLTVKVLDDEEGFSGLKSNNSDCSGLLNPLYTTFHSKSDKELLETLYQIYSGSKENYNSKKIGWGLSAVIPEYGSYAFNSNKKKVAGMVEKYSGRNDYKLSITELQEIGYSFVDPAVAVQMYREFNVCNGTNSFQPRLVLLSNTKEKVICQLYLPPNAQRIDKVKLRGLESSNLTYDPRSGSRVRSNERIRYSSTYTLCFNRGTSKDGGRIIVSLDTEQPLSVNYESVDQPVCEYKWFSSDENGDPYIANASIRFEYNKKRIIATQANGTSSVIAWNRKSPVRSMIYTEFNLDSVTIINIHPSYTTKHFKSIKTTQDMKPDSRIVNVLTEIYPTKHTSTVTFSIYYKKYRKVCKKVDA